MVSLYCFGWAPVLLKELVVKETKGVGIVVLYHHSARHVLCSSSLSFGKRERGTKSYASHCRQIFIPHSDSNLGVFARKMRRRAAATALLLLLLVRAMTR